MQLCTPLHYAIRCGHTAAAKLLISAGANIDALTYEFYPNVIDGFIGFYGAYDLTRFLDFSHQVEGMIKTYTSGDMRKLAGASPILRQSYPKSFLLYHGSEDIMIHPIQSALMARVHGGEFHLIDKAKHGFLPFGTKERPAPWVERLVRYCYNQ